MRCPRCYKNRKRDANGEYPQMNIEEINNDEVFVCPLCEYSLLKE